MKKLTAVETLAYMAEQLTASLKELQECEEENEFIYGEKTAYVECLEWLQRWRDAAKHGIDYDVEKRFVL